MNLNLVDISRRKDLFQMEKYDKIDEFIKEQNHWLTTPSTARALSPQDIFTSSARINHLLILNEKDQFRSTKNLRKKSQESKINYQRVIIQKLYKSEHQNASMSKQIKRYEDKIEQLEDEVRVLKTIINEENLDHYNCIIKENHKLKKENDKMKAFFDDYGLKWVDNDNQEGEFKLDTLLNDLNLAKDEVLYKWDNKTLNMLDLDFIIQKVNTLNSKFMRSYKPSLRNKEKEPDSMKIKFYKNGFKIGTLKYFSYVSREAHNILKDIIDGFYPSYIKSVYPEGIIINWVNKSYKTYEYATAKVMNLNIGGAYSPYGPLADSEDDAEKDMQLEIEKRK